MKNKLCYLLLGILLTASSCSDNYLDESPDTQIPESQDFFNTEDGLKIFSDGFYAYFNYNGIKNDNNISDNCEHFGSPGAIRTSKYSLPTALGSGGWSWTSIRNVNYFIARCEASTVAPDIRNRYLGLARFFRAFLYFDKVKAFGDVPWYSKTLSTEDKDLYKPRDPRTLVMDSVLNDLDFAVKYLPQTKYHNRISKWTALAYKSRICLYEGTWRKYHPSYKLPEADKFIQAAADAAGELIKKGPYKLYSTGNAKDDYKNLFLQTTASADECILAYSFPQDKTGNSISWDNFFTDMSNGNNGATRSLVEDYFMADGSSFINKYPATTRETMPFYQEVKDRDPRLAATVIIPGYVRNGTSDTRNYGDFMQNRTGYQICKRVGPEPYNDYRDVILMRYAEVLLNYAEAETELGYCNQELLDETINPIRARVGLSKRTYPMQTDEHQREMYKNIANDDNLCEIRHERRVELAIEGLRYDDMIRWGEGHLFREPYEGIYVEKGINQPIDLDGDGNNDVAFVRVKPSQQNSSLTYIVLQPVNGFTNGDDKGGRIIPYDQQYKPFADWEYLNPIPTEELTLNPALKQNPGWDSVK